MAEEGFASRIRRENERSELFGTKISIPNTVLHFNGFLGIAPQPKSRDVAFQGLDPMKDLKIK